MFYRCFFKYKFYRIKTFLKAKKNYELKFLDRLTQNIQNNFNSNQYTGTVMFDMEKAFERV
jgi:hypothetical protein